MTHEPSPNDATPAYDTRTSRHRRFLTLLTTALGLSLMTHAALAEQITGSGSAAVTSYVVTSTRQAGPNTILTLEVTATLTGILEGTSQATETATVHPDGTTNIEATETFTGKVNGVAGTLVLQSVGVLDAAGSLQGQFTIVSASDCLDGLRGQGNLRTAAGSGAYDVTLVYPEPP